MRFGFGETKLFFNSLKIKSIETGKKRIFGGDLEENVV